MSLRRKIAAVLDAHPGDAGPSVASAEEGPYRLSLRLTSSGRVGVEFEELEFAVAGRAEWSPEAMKGWADRLAARLTYLMEPLVVLEADPVGGEVALRSQAPTARDGLHSYYEVRLRRDGTLRLGRVAFDEADRRRRPAPCRMTREALERLVDDLVAAVA